MNMKKILLLFVFAAAMTNVFGTGTTYYWVGTSSGAWNSANNWSLTKGGAGGDRTTPDPGDILIFDGNAIAPSGNTTANAQTVTVTGLGTETISHLIIMKNSTITSSIFATAGPSSFTVTLNSGAALTVSNDLIIGSSTCTFNDGGSTVVVGGNLVNAGATAGSGKIQLTGSSSSQAVCYTTMSTGITSTGTGYAANELGFVGTPWTAGMSTTSGTTQVVSNGILYTAQTTGTAGATAPSGYTASQSDGNVTWTFAGLPCIVTVKTVTSGAITGINFITTGCGYINSSSGNVTTFTKLSGNGSGASLSFYLNKTVSSSTVATFTTNTGNPSALGTATNVQLSASNSTQASTTPWKDQYVIPQPTTGSASNTAGAWIINGALTLSTGYLYLRTPSYVNGGTGALASFLTIGNNNAASVVCTVNSGGVAGGHGGSTSPAPTGSGNIIVNSSNTTSGTSAGNLYFENTTIAMNVNTITMTKGYITLNSSITTSSNPGLKLNGGTIDDGGNIFKLANSFQGTSTTAGFVSHVSQPGGGLFINGTTKTLGTANSNLTIGNLILPQGAGTGAHTLLCPLTIKGILAFTGANALSTNGFNLTMANGSTVLRANASGNVSPTAASQYIFGSAVNDKVNFIASVASLATGSELTATAGNTGCGIGNVTIVSGGYTLNSDLYMAGNWTRQVTSISLPSTATALNSNSVTVSSSAGVLVGSTVSCTGIPSGSVVLGIPDATHLLLSNVATATGSATLTIAAGSFTPNTKAVFFNGSGTQTITSNGGGTETFDYFVLNNTGTGVQLSSSPATNVTVQASAGDVLQLLNSGSLDINGQTFLLSGTAGSIALGSGARNIKSTAANGTFSISGGTKTVTAGGTLVFDANTNIVLSNGFNPGSGFTTINGTLQLNVSGFVSTNAPTYGSGSTIKYNTTGTFARSIEWNSTATSGAGYPYHVKLSNSTTLNYPNGSTSARFIAGNLTVDAGSALYMDYGTSGLSNPLTVAGSVTFNGPISLGDAIGGDLYVGGSWTRASTGAAFVTHSRAVFFNGSNSQTITNTGGETFDYLTISNTSGGVSLASNLTVNSALNLSSGTLSVGVNTLTLPCTLAVTSGNLSTSSSSNLSFTGPNAYNLPTGVTNVNNFTINNASANVTLNTNIAIAGSLALTNGTLSGGTNIITVAGNITGTTGIHTSSGSGKISMTGSGTSFTASTYGNFEIAGGTNVSPISASGSANFASGSTFTVTSGSYYNSSLNTMQFGGASPVGTVNIYGTASTTRGNGFYGSFNSAFGGSVQTGYSAAGLSVNFLSGSTAIYNALTQGQTISALTYNNLVVTGTRTGTGNISLSNSITINGDYTIDTDLSGSTISFTSPSSTTLTFNGSRTQNLNFTNSANIIGTSAINLFNLTINSGSNVVSNVDIPVAGSLSGTGTFSSVGNKITMTGPTKNISGMSISNLEINSAGTITTTATPTITGTLSLTAGILNKSTNGLTLSDGATIALTNGTLLAAPTFGTTVNLIYNGSSIKGNEFPATDIINTLTANNTAGITLADNRNIPNVTIGSGSFLTINAGKQLTVSTTMTNDGTLNLLSTSNGTATILTPEAIDGSGTTNVQQRLTIATGGRNWFISSPVTAATSAVVKDKVSSKLWKYTEANTGTILWDEITVSNQNLEVGRGYVAKLASDDVITFNGTLNNGDITSPTLTSSGTVSKGFNLVGNPYPSYVNWTSAIKNNVNTSIWYRSKSTGSYLFQTFNVEGDGVGANGGTDIIPPMQSFWVKVPSGTGTVGFTNLMRSHQDQSDPTNRLKAPAVSTQKLLRLQVSNAVNADEAVVYFNANAQDGYDAYDSPKMSNANIAIPEIYTTVGGEQLVINGMNSIAANKEIPLGFNTGAANTFTIKATEVRNFDADTKVILKDNVLNTESDITDGTAYTFSSDVTNTSSRFTVVFRSPSLTTDGLENNPIDKLGLNIFRNANNQITINRNGSIGNEGMVTVCNAIGQKLMSTPTTGTSTVISKPFSSGVYFVTVNMAGNKTTKKVIIN
jgi:hypothetical protein